MNVAGPSLPSQPVPQPEHDATAAATAAVPAPAPAAISAASLPARRPVAPSVAPSAPSSPGGFSGHIADAIALNESRRDIYAQLSGGKSTAITDKLVREEKLAHLTTWYFDAAARKFNARGIPIVTGDFVPMTPAPAPETPPVLRGKTPPADLSKLSSDVRAFHASVLLHAVTGNFEQIGADAYALLAKIDALETRTGSNLAMTRHIVDSIGFAALHATTYANESGGETKSLSSQLIAAESLGLVGAVDLDRDAQSVQAQGVGILVNDLPKIPFQAEWQAAHPGT